MMAPYLLRLFCLCLAVFFRDPLSVVGLAVALSGAGGDSRGAANAARARPKDFC